MNRVVITGRGMRTPLGHHIDDVFDAIMAGRTGVAVHEPLKRIDGLRCHLAAAIDDFDGREIPRKYRRTMGKLAMFAAAAAGDAVMESQITEELLTSGRMGVACGSTVGSGSAEEEFWRHYFEKQSTRGLRSTVFFRVMSHTCATNVALLLGITGEVIATNAACASATQAIGTGYGRIRTGQVDLMLVGGADELHETAVMTFDIVGGAATNTDNDPDRAPRPFDRDRQGIIVGEGGGMLVLENRDHALARGATIYGEVLGYGANCDARHMSAPEPGGMKLCIEKCLGDAGLPASTVDYVNAHATGTRIGDASEAEALYAVFGEHVPVSSSKGHLGHMLGACGAVEAAVCLEAMSRGVVPPTRNLVHPDVAPIALPVEPVERRLNTVLSTNFAFGGINTAVLLGAHREA